MMMNIQSSSLLNESDIEKCEKETKIERERERENGVTTDSVIFVAATGVDVAIGLRARHEALRSAMRVNAQEDLKTLTVITFAVQFAFVFPFMFCDLYFATTYQTQAKGVTGTMTLTLYDYMIGSGIISAVYLVMTIVAARIGLSSSRSSDDISEPIEREVALLAYFVVELICAALSSIWLIVGSIIFWADATKAQLPGPIYDYVYTALICKYVLIFLGAITKINE